MRRTLGNTLGISVTVAVLAWSATGGRVGVQEDAAPLRPSILGRAGAPTTSRDDLTRTIERMEAQLAARPHDREAALLLADALMRQARVTGNTALPRRAVDVMEPLVEREPLDYEARRMLATVYASEHRFRDAIREARKARDAQPDDPWNYGILGDSHLELGDYDQAFAAFQTMVDLKPSAASYSRLSYGLELQGRLEDAIEAMTLAVDATTPRDPESIAWFRAHLADLYVQVGRLPDARREYAWAERAFPGHPYVRAGLARLMEAEGDTAGALAMYREEFAKLGTPDLAALIGDIYARLGRHAEAEAMFQAAEAQWRRAGPAEQDHLARFLADHDRKIDEAVRLAEDGAATARDIAAQDALAWVYYKAGRLQEADRAAAQALRTGTRNLSILYHAAVIRRALGDDEGASQLLDRAPRGARAPARIAVALDALRAR